MCTPPGRRRACAEAVVCARGGCGGRPGGPCARTQEGEVAALAGWACCVRFHVESAWASQRVWMRRVEPPLALRSLCKEGAVGGRLGSSSLSQADDTASGHMRAPGDQVGRRAWEEDRCPRANPCPCVSDRVHGEPRGRHEAPGWGSVQGPSLA